MDLLPGLPDEIGLECLVRIPPQYFFSVSSVCKSWKRQIEHPEFWRRRKASGSTRRVLVLAQSRVGSGREWAVEKFAYRPVYGLTVCEPETGYWALLPPIPGLPYGLPMFCQMVGIGSDLVILGGCDSVMWEVSSAVYVYSFVSATWRRGADMPGCPRLLFAACAGSGQTVFVAGGHDREKCALRSAMAYDVAGDEWIVLPDMSEERDEAMGVFHCGKFHVIGGYETNTQGRFGTSVEAFDWGTWTWGPIEKDFLDSATCPRNIVAEDGDGMMYTCRGTKVVTRHGSTWRPLVELPGHVLYVVYLTAWQGKVVVIGSQKFGNEYVACVYDLKRKRWEKVKTSEEFLGYVQSGCCLEL